MNIAKAILATLLYGVFIEVVAVWLLIAYFLEIKNWEPYYLFIQSLFQFAGIFAFLQIFSVRDPTSRSERKGLKWYLIATILGVSFVFIQNPLNVIYNCFFGSDYYVLYDFNGLKNLWDINIISVVLIIPVTEELFFRNYVQKGVHKKYRPIIAVLIASVLFASIHAPWRSLIDPVLVADWHLSFITLFGGLISGFLFYRSKALGPSIVFHIMWNILATLT